MPRKLKSRLFHAHADKGHTLRVLVDIFSHSLQRTTLRIDSEGILIRDVAPKETILFNLELEREKFKEYKCKNPIYIAINIKQAHKMLAKSINKKAMVIMYILKKEPDKLRFEIYKSASDRDSYEEVGLAVERLDEEKLPLLTPLPETTPEGEDVYLHPRVVSSDFFQRIKKVAQVGSKQITVTMNGSRGIAFHADNNINDSSIKDGNFESGEYSGEYSGAPEEGSESSSESEELVKFEEDFNTDLLTSIIKLHGLCSNMSFYPPCISMYPLKIKMMAGELGTFTVYVKCTRQLQLEEEYKRKERQDSRKTTE